MIIVFGNQKGGCGKTTNCIQFANYIADKGMETLVLDLDFQRSITDRRQEDINTYDNEPKYEVIQANMEDLGKLIEDFTKIEKGNLLIDLPGRIDDDALIPILKNADVIICPFKYDKLTMDSTGFFIRILEHLQAKAQIFFLPNNIKKSIRYDTKEQIYNVLSQYGKITPEIPDRVAMERVNTLVITSEAINVVEETYNYIIKEAKIK